MSEEFGLLTISKRRELIHTFRCNKQSSVEHFLFLSPYKILHLSIERKKEKKNTCDSSESMECCFDADTSPYLPKQLKENYNTDSFYYDSTTKILNCKLLEKNPYRKYFQRVYPEFIHDNQLTNEMLDVLKSYTDSVTNRQCYLKTNLNLLSENFDQIDWIYVNQLRSLIRGLISPDIKHAYYRGLTLSDMEIRYYLDRCGECYYTNSFTSFTIDRLLVYAGNALLILQTDHSTEKSKKNLANIWKWSACSEEKEALLVVGTKLKILSVHYYGCKWEIVVQLMEDDEEILTTRDTFFDRDIQ